MRTPRSCARLVRGGLIGVCSAVTTAVAHTFAGGSLPSGSALVAVVLVCAMVGAAASRLRFEERRIRTLGVVVALGLAQALGHLTFLLTGHAHSADGSASAGVMVSAHIGAAVALGTAIAAVEYLYAVCMSVLRWLRLYVTLRSRSQRRLRRCAVNAVVADKVLFSHGFGMRAPPARVALAI